MKRPTVERSGARFFDETSRDRGWASHVTERPRGLGSLTVLDVTDPEPGLAAFLAGLEESQLTVQCTDMAGATYRFRWASGYENGTDFRVQGVLER